VLLHQADSAFTDFGGILVGFAHGFILSREKASSKPGAVHIRDTWDDVLGVSELLDMTLDANFMKSALSLFPSVGLDGYDLFMAEAALKAGITQIVTDDCDYATVPGLTVFTANRKVIGESQKVGKLIATR
jgi:hypothetical protein